MPIETDEQALARALDENSQLFDWPDECLACDLEQLWAAIQDGTSSNPKLPHSVFFSYMRFNKDGTFHSTNWYHAGDDQPITPNPDASDENNIGFWIRDMALHARAKHKSKYQYKEWGRGLEGFKFPKRYSYCVYFMDDLNWKFLNHPVTGKPVVNFRDEKLGVTYIKHRHAFSPPTIYRSIMPNDRTGLDDERESMVMINRMSNAQDVPLKHGEKEEYCFDLWMRVRYAGQSNGVTLIIDPRGENEGPPGPPPGP
ncbi:MAG: hypothetical protein AAGE86_01000 [Pseudomonadota bacterium]